MTTIWQFVRQLKMLLGLLFSLPFLLLAGLFYASALRPDSGSAGLVIATFFALLSVLGWTLMISAWLQWRRARQQQREQAVLALASQRQGVLMAADVSEAGLMSLAQAVGVLDQLTHANQCDKRVSEDGGFVYRFDSYTDAQLRSEAPPLL